MGLGNRYVAAVVAAGLSSGVVLAAGPFDVLTGLERGRWQLKGIGEPAAREVCLSDPWRLVQLDHPGPACSRFVIEDSPSRVAIQYNCGPRGYGRTTITPKQPGVIRLDTQGILPDGQPFDTSYEGHFVGPCAPPPAR